MMVRVGVDASIDEAVLDFTKEVNLVRVPEEPAGDIAVGFWVAAMPPRVLRRQWPHLKGVKVIQAPWAGVDTLLKLFPPEVILCDARGVHAIPTAEWALAAHSGHGKVLATLYRNAAPGQVGGRTASAAN
jgi:phosphoglycerate dehydrogenase-like enzyme